MKMRFVWVGKTKRTEISRLVADYLDRIGRFARVEVVQIRDRTRWDSRVVEMEAKALLERVETDPFVVVLDQKGRELDSNGLAALVEKQRMRGAKQITFVVGGFGGISTALAGRADLLLSLSKMTLTHEMARLVIVEQVYRAFTILHRLPYPK